MGAIVETPSIYVDLTAYENLKEQYKVLGIPSDDGISEILKLVGLENTGNKKAKNFSLGMRQRLGIAVALAGSPDFLVLDEPVNGLDPQGIIEIRELILKLNQEHGITVLISSHILDELSKLATYYGFIDNGKMIKQISSIELESKCRKCTHLKVSSTKTLAYVLDTMNIEYKILSNTEADIFEKVNISKLTTELSKKDCEVISIHEHDESLESYFVSLVGGARHTNAVLYVLDPKNADLADLGTVMGNVYHTKEEMIDCVNAFYEGMVQRSEEMKRHPNYKTGENYAYLGLPPCFLIFDEYVAFFEMLGTKESVSLLSQLKKIVMLGRQAGYFLIVACQRPDAKYFSDGIRDNFNFRVGLGRISELGYSMLFGSDVKKQFFQKRIKGRGYCDVGTSVISEFYTPLVPKGHDFLQTIGSLAQARQDGTATCEAKGDGTD